MSVQATLNLSAAAARPDIYRRVLAIVLDGLRPARQGPSRLPVRPLTDDDLHSGHPAAARGGRPD
jgi:hypothetical protein